MLKVRVDKQRPGHLEVFLEEDHIITLQTALVGKRPQIPTAVVDEEQLRVQLDRLLARSAKNFAIRSLAKQAQTSGELKQKLIRRGSPDALASDVVSHCVTMGYINDEECIARYVEVQIAKGNGPMAIRQKLREKRVDSVLVERMLTSYDEEAQYLSAFQLVHRRYHREQQEGSERARRKIAGALQRRGFSSCIISKILSQS